MSIIKRGEYFNPYLGGFFLGLVLFAAFFLTGNGLGASGAIQNIQIAIIDFIAPGHVDSLGYIASKAGGDKNPLASPSVFMFFGTLLGGFLSGWINRRVKVEIRKGPKISNKQRLIFAFIGGSIMGYGARFARGCTSGQALSGGAVLSFGSWTFMISVFAGGYMLAYFVRKLWN